MVSSRRCEAPVGIYCAIIFAFSGAVCEPFLHHASATLAEVVRGEGELALDEPVAAIAPGQSLVIYDSDRVLGGGIIEQKNAYPPARCFRSCPTVTADSSQV